MGRANLDLQEADTSASNLLLSGETQTFLRLAARSRDPVLLHGETGVGKTRIARLIHERSMGSGHPFVHVNCASIPEHLFEREMFGNVRGAFTDARDARPGLIETADCGTLFLDEIGELPLSLQPKLLHVLEEGEVRRLGAVRSKPAQFRLITATNRDLDTMIAAGGFREDLYYRCAVLEHRLLPLRERMSELEEIIECLQNRVAMRGEARAELTSGALPVLQRYGWPGNLRELDNCLRQAAIYAEGGPIQVHHLPHRVRARTGPCRSHGKGAGGYVAPADPSEEEATIMRALREAGGNRTRAARHLGMSRATLWIKIQRYGLDRETPGISRALENKVP